MIKFDGPYTSLSTTLHILLTCHESNMDYFPLIFINVTQHGTWYPSGDLGNSSKSIIKRYNYLHVMNPIWITSPLFS